MGFQHQNIKSLKFLVLITGILHVARGGNSPVKINNFDCEIPIGSKNLYMIQWPLVYKPNGELYPTIVDNKNDEIKVIVKAGDEVVLSCGPNFLKNFNRKEVLNAFCNKSTGNFTINQVDTPIRDLRCDLRVIEEVTGNVYGCAGAKVSTSRFGYVDPIKKTTIVLGEACYDMGTGTTHFVHFKLGDTSSSYLDEQPKNYLTTLPHPDGRYKIELFRGLRFDEIYERIRTTLHVRQVPELKLVHFMEEPLLGNSQFQSVKKLGWNYYVGYDENETLENLKKDIKELSKTKNLEVYIGSHGIKKLHGNDGTNMEVYLHQTAKRFSMPEFLWFVVKHDNKATAFAIRNADQNENRLLHDKNEVQANSICTSNNCEKISYLSIDLKQDNNLICCDVNDIRQNVQEVPVIADINGLLT